MFPSVEFETLPPELRWRCERIEAGGTVSGWIAGPMVGIRGHWDGFRTQPCRAHLTGGAMLCDCQVKPMNNRVVGYVPLLTRDREKLVVIVSAGVAKRVKEIKPGTPVKFGRTLKKKTPLTVELLRDEALGVEDTKRMKHIACHDISSYLLHLWQDEQLTRFFGQEYRRSLNAARLNPPAEGAA